MARNDVKHRRDGFQLPQDTLADLATVAKLAGIENFTLSD